MGNILKKYNLTKAHWEVVGGAITGDTLPIGAIMPYTSKTTPSNWLPCNGQAVSRTTYADLFAIIGEQYGSGDGSTTFNVPDLNDYKVPIGYDRFEEQSNRMNLGTTGGEETHKLTIEEMPKHSHTINQMLGYLEGDTNPKYAVQWGNTRENTGITKDTQGNSMPHNNMQPYVTTNYIIKAFQSAGVVGNVVNEKTTSDKDTYSCDYINGISNYSTEEKVVGEWIDGKPIYRKVFVLDEAVLVELAKWINIVDVSSLNINVITDITMISEQFAWTGAITRINSNYLQIAGTGRDDTAWYVKTIILEYTKTTD